MGMGNAKVSSTDYSPIILVGLIGLDAVLISWLLFQPLTMQFVYLLQILGLAVVVICLLQHYRFAFLFKPLIVIFAGGLGLLLGCILDYGQFGLQTLSSLCLAPTSGSGPENIIRMASLAPWTHMGMWLSCSVALIIVDHQRGHTTVGCYGGVKHVFCMVGMLFGMWSFEVLPSVWLLFVVDYSAIGPVGLMWLGMSVGLMGSYLIFDARLNRIFLH